MPLRRMFKPVCGAALVSLISLITLASRAPTEVSPERAVAPEPSGPLNAGARLIGLTGTGKNLRAKVEINLLSHLSGAEVTIEEGSERTKGQDRAVLARTHVERGRAHFLHLERGIVDGMDNHLTFRVRSKGDDGSTEEVNVYLQVSLDDSTAPTLVGEYLVYQGSQVSDVTGGLR